MRTNSTFLRSHRLSIPLSTTLLVAFLSGAAAPGVAEEPAYRLLGRAVSDDSEVRREAIQELRESGDRSFLPGLVDGLFYASARSRIDLFEYLEEATGEKLPRRYHAWVEYIGKHPEIEPKPGYLEWKLAIFSKIDPDFAKVFYPGAPTRIRPEEIISGGVGLDGIPSLDFPKMVPASKAKYLKDSEQVFGVFLGDEARAYPVRFLSWHEMLNDTVGGEPVTLSFCTLCGSGILYSTSTPNGGRYDFGTSGFLYRSNKLMFDRQTYSLWSNLTGEPVVGRLARGTIRLKVLPMTLTTWSDWLRRHPETTVIALDKELTKRFPFPYKPGAADQARRGVSFPVWQQSQRLKRDDDVYALRIGEATKAYLLDAVFEQGVLNDQLGEANLVLIGDPESGSVRVYERGSRSFWPTDTPDRVVDSDGSRWMVEEDELVPLAELGTDSLSESLPRIPGHVARWFGWFGFYPDTEVFDGKKE